MNEIRNKLSAQNITIKGNIAGLKRIVVPLSGGKDSQVCLKLALEQYDCSEVLAVFCDTKFEHPLTYEHIGKVVDAANVDLITRNNGSVLSVCVKYKRFPGGGARHCTDDLKIRPSKYLYKYLAETQRQGFEVWCGVRTDESKERAQRYKGKLSDETYAPHEFMSKFPKYLETLGISFRLPIIDWAKDEVISFLNGAENPLYKHGFDRVGCFPCLASGESHQMRAFYFDEVGNKHFQIAQEIGRVANRPVLTSKKYFDQGPGCSLCSI